MTVLVVLETVVLAVLVVLVSGLLRSHATILRRFNELGVDSAERPTPGHRREERADGGGGAPLAADRR